MTKVYTDIWNGFQFRAPNYLDGHFEPHKFDLVKWVEHEPYEVLDFYTGEKIMSTKHCYTVGMLVWDDKEPGFTFESCGLRYLVERIDGLEEFILDFCDMMEKELLEED